MKNKNINTWISGTSKEDEFKVTHSTAYYKLNF